MIEKYEIYFNVPEIYTYNQDNGYWYCDIVHETVNDYISDIPEPKKAPILLNSFLLSNLPVDLTGIYELTDFIKNFEKKSVSAIYIKSLFVKLFAWKQENNKIRFAIQEYNEIHKNFKDDFVFIYDVLVDKKQFIEEFRKIIPQAVEEKKKSKNYPKF